MLKRSSIMMFSLAFTSLFIGNIAVAASDIKVGVIAPLTGPYAVTGQRYKQGIDAFRANYGTTVGGRQVEIVYRDMAGGDPSKAKTFAEELIVKDGVSLIGGFYLSPESVAAAPILTQAKVPGVAFIGSSMAVGKASPYLLRSAGVISQPTNVEADYALSLGHKRAYVVVGDYSSGNDLLPIFRKRFIAGGGTIAGEEKVPLSTVDYSAIAERVAASNPDLIVTFVPAGAPSVSLVKALAARGLLANKKIMSIGWGWLDDSDLKNFSSSVVGAYQTQIYSAQSTENENVKFLSALKKLSPDITPSYEAASAYDSMMVIYHMIASQAGSQFDGVAAIKSVVGWKMQGSRGEQIIDPDTRSASLNIFISQVIEKDGKLVLKLRHEVPNVSSRP